ncbi:MAG: DUF2628 domain-containing protein [Moraxellaceae bacterium]|nr:MAG: DUF2628 domain-containing protein [Moraxellaceae bacterium]
MVCSECHVRNSVDSNYCAGCGNVLPHVSMGCDPARVQVSSPAISAVLPTESDKAYKSLSRKEQYQAVIGSNQQHYLKKFMEFDGEGKGRPSWHWPAFFMTTYWMLYRKMWRNALLYSVLPYGVVLIVIGVMLGFHSIDPSTTGLLFLGTMLGLGIVPALYADALYYNHCQQVIIHARQHTSHPHRLYGVLSTRGGTCKRLTIIFMGLLLVASTLAVTVMLIYNHNRLL